MLMGFNLQVYRIGGDEFAVLFYDEVTKESLIQHQNRWVTYSTRRRRPQTPYHC